ncbi:hypothetical protein GWK47_042008 [Chionoecetes opilio]|uniref:Uncharacterized protein n=1 Tax=Chionoecetes opilio TaxID=41210 RepID=A0A8J4YBS9_CHIOP|nr:hypothetical protein GWK47_042008 [Chionoecetes opilio]
MATGEGAVLVEAGDLAPTTHGSGRVGVGPGTVAMLLAGLKTELISELKKNNQDISEWQREWGRGLIEAREEARHFTREACEALGEELAALRLAVELQANALSAVLGRRQLVTPAPVEELPDPEHTSGLILETPGSARHHLHTHPAASATRGTDVMWR